MDQSYGLTLPGRHTRRIDRLTTLQTTSPYPGKARSGIVVMRKWNISGRRGHFSMWRSNSSTWKRRISNWNKGLYKWKWPPAIGHEPTLGLCGSIGKVINSMYGNTNALRIVYEADQLAA
jgi:hypothetical protein